MRCMTANGKFAAANEVIFPLVKENFDGSIALLGTAFFIQHQGVFVTAKHVLMDIVELDSRGQFRFKAHVFGIQFLEKNQYIQRPVVTFTVDNAADFAVGRLQPMHKPTTKEPLTNKVVSLTLSELEKDDPVTTYAYPNTVIQNLKSTGSQNAAHFWPMYYQGKVVECFPQGRDRSMLPNPCYQTTMVIHGGASGGPVFNKHGKVCALNSSGYPDMLDVSFISRINEILPLQVHGMSESPELPERGYSILELCQLKQIHINGL